MKTFSNGVGHLACWTLLLSLATPLLAAPMPDSFYLRKLPPLKVQHQGQTDDLNPHQVACTAVEMCRQGRVKQEIVRFKSPSVLEDPRVADAFVRLLTQAATQLKTYRHRPLYLIFLGVVDGRYISFETLSVWYYALGDAQGHILPHSPLITVHRSRGGQNCALAEVGTDMVTRKAIQLPSRLVRPH